MILRSKRAKLKPQYKQWWQINSKIILYLLLGLMLTLLAFFGTDIIKQRLPKFNQLHYDIKGQIPAPSLRHIKKQVDALLPKYYADADTYKIKNTILKNAWVKTVIISRPFWNRLHIHIKTRQIALRLNQKSYIDENGEAFSPSWTLKSNIVLAIGNKNNAKAIYDAYKNYQKTLGEHFIIKLIKYDQVSEININNNTLLKLGYDKQIERLRKFNRIYPNLVEKYKTIDHLVIDLRYKQGVSVHKQ